MRSNGRKLCPRLLLSLADLLAPIFALSLRLNFSFHIRTFNRICFTLCINSNEFTVLQYCNHRFFNSNISSQSIICSSSTFDVIYESFSIPSFYHNFLLCLSVINQSLNNWIFPSSYCNPICSNTTSALPLFRPTVLFLYSFSPSIQCPSYSRGGLSLVFVFRLPYSSSPPFFLSFLLSISHTKSINQREREKEVSKESMREEDRRRRILSAREINSTDEPLVFKHNSKLGFVVCEGCF